MSFDAIVIGAGPSGCAAATALARHGRSALLVDRDPKPRFKIGESLLPLSMPLFEQIGLLPKIRAAGFQEKYGAMFWNERTGGTRAVVFKDGLSPDHPSAFQVKREIFDGLFADHAASCGATVRRGVKAEEVIFEGDRAVGLALTSEAGREEIRSKVVIDASGQAALLASRLQMREGDPNLKRAAVYAHYRGVWRGEGQRAGDILLPFLPNVWYWLIPFSDGTTSVGAVCDPSLFKDLVAQGIKTKDAQLEHILGLSKKVKELLAGAERLTPAAGVADYSITAKRFSGDGWVLVGDSATFLDPVFSTGVLLGTSAGVRAANVIHASLAKKGRVDGADFATYEKVTRKMVNRFKPYVYGFYDPIFSEMFCSPEPMDILRAAVVSTLAGDVEKPSFRTLFWNGMARTAFAFGHLMGRLKPTPPQPA